MPLELNPMMIDIIRRMEDATGLSITADGFPAELTDDQPEVPGAEVTAHR